MVRKLFGLASPRGEFELKTTFHGWGGVLKLMVDKTVSSLKPTKNVWSK